MSVATAIAASPGRSISSARFTKAQIAVAANAAATAQAAAFRATDIAEQARFALQRRGWAVSRKMTDLSHNEAVPIPNCWVVSGQRETLTDAELIAFAAKKVPDFKKPAEPPAIKAAPASPRESEMETKDEPALMTGAEMMHRCGLTLAILREDGKAIADIIGGWDAWARIAGVGKSTLYNGCLGYAKPGPLLLGTIYDFINDGTGYRLKQQWIDVLDPPATTEEQNPEGASAATTVAPDTGREATVRRSPSSPEPLFANASSHAANIAGDQGKAVPLARAVAEVAKVDLGDAVDGVEDDGFVTVRPPVAVTEGAATTAPAQGAAGGAVAPVTADATGAGAATGSPVAAPAQLPDCPTTGYAADGAPGGPFILPLTHVGDIGADTGNRFADAITALEALRGDQNAAVAAAFSAFTAARARLDKLDDAAALLRELAA